MVDFNNEATVGVPAVDIERITILQRRYDFLEALEDYKKKKSLGVNISLNIVRARLGSLFFEIQATLKRRLLKDTALYDDIKNKCLSTKTTEDNIQDIFFIINQELDNIKLTRVDNKNQYDFSLTEEDNKNAGL
jgi:hypothetical protein